MLSTATAAWSQTSFANRQTQPVKHFEAELFAGPTYPIGHLGDLDNRFLAGFGLEMRYNFDQKPFDLGFQLGLTTNMRHVAGTDYDDEQTNRVLQLALVSDWNFAQGRKVNPYAGLGLGVGHRDIVNEDYYPAGDGTWTLIAMPRVGVELFRHLRLTLSSNIAGKGYNNVQLSLGVVIGGRPKK